MRLKSAKGAARTSEPGKELIAPHSVLREFLKSAKGAVRTSEPGKELIAPHSVLREFFKREVTVAGRSLERAAGWLAVLSIAMIALMLGRPYFSNASRPQHGIDDPVLALQMAADVSDIDAILSDAPSPDRETMRLKQYLDFGFIVCYTGLYLVLCALLSRQFAWGRIVAIAAAVCAAGAGASDVTENLAILRICAVPLSQTTQAMVDAIRLPSLAKWALAFAAIALLSSYFLSSRRWALRTVGMVNVVTVVLGAYGLFVHPFLTYAGIPMLAGLLGIAAVFFR